MAKWIRRWFPEPKIEGSSPFRDARIYGLVGYDVCLRACAIDSHVTVPLRSGDEYVRTKTYVMLFFYVT